MLRGSLCKASGGLSGRTYWQGAKEYIPKGVESAEKADRGTVSVSTWLLWFPCSASMDCAGDPVLCWFQMGSMLVPTGFQMGSMEGPRIERRGWREAARAGETWWVGGR